MKDKINNSRFALLYIWMTKAKYTMGIFYTAFVLFYLFFGEFFASPKISLDFAVAIEMCFACFFIGLAQQALISVNKLSGKRCMLWVVIGSIITLLFSVVFRWFEGFPFWCFILFHVLAVLSMAAMLISYYFELHQETQKLNQYLEVFQKSKE